LSDSSAFHQRKEEGEAWDHQSGWINLQAFPIETGQAYFPDFLLSLSGEDGDFRKQWHCIENKNKL